MQEELTCHEVEWEVVESPSQDGHTDLVIESFKRDVVVVTEATLPAEDSETLDSSVENDECGGGPPYKRISH